MKAKLPITSDRLTKRRKLELQLKAYHMKEQRRVKLRTWKVLKQSRTEYDLRSVGVRPEKFQRFSTASLAARLRISSKKETGKVIPLNLEIRLLMSSTSCMRFSPSSHFNDSGANL